MNRQNATQTLQLKPTATPSASGLLQRKCDCGNHTIAGGECEECKNTQTLQRASLSPRGRGTKGEGEVPPIVHEVLRSSGRPLDPTSPAFLEPRFDHDFSQVRVHTDTQAVESGLDFNTFQRKLAISTPEDAYEREADHIAEVVVNAFERPTSFLTRFSHRVKGISALSVQRQEDEASDELENDEGEEEIEDEIENDTERGMVQTMRTGATGVEAPSQAHSYLASARGSGQLLDQSTQETMSAFFGHDFSGVRVHPDARAAASARSVNALAYTVGRDIVFGAGQYAPGTAEGRKLLAHELTHVVQQAGGSAGAPFVQKKVMLGKTEMGKKARKAFIEARKNKWKRRTLANAVMEDMAAATDTFNFTDEAELETEIVKRVATVKYTQESQQTFEGDKKAFGYPFNPPAEVYGPRVNYAARDYWEPGVVDNYAVRKDKKKKAEMLKMSRRERCKVYGDQCSGYGWALSDKGKADPYEAIVKLFTPQASPRKRTLLHCDYLISLVNFRSFADSVGKDEFNKRIKAFGVDKIKLRWNAFNDLHAEVIMTDPAGKPVKKPGSLQRVRPSSEADLVIGDHVIFYNHLAYDLINEKIGNAWRLENAVLTGKNKDGDDVFLGHGSGYKTTKQMNGKLAEEFNDVAKKALGLVKQTKSRDKKVQTDARDELSKRFPKVKEDGSEWKIQGKGKLCKKTDVDLELREIKRDEVIGLKEPCDLTKLEEVQRPVESK